MYGVPPMKLSKKVSKMILFKAFFEDRNWVSVSICTSAETYLQCHETVFSKGINPFFTHFFFNNTNNVSFLSFFSAKSRTSVLGPFAFFRTSSRQPIRPNIRQLLLWFSKELCARGLRGHMIILELWRTRQNDEYSDWIFWVQDVVCVIKESASPHQRNKWLLVNIVRET